MILGALPGDIGVLGHLVQDILDTAQLRTGQIGLFVVAEVYVSLIQGVIIYGGTSRAASLWFAGRVSILIGPFKHIVCI